jgi:hypothetical protein
VSVANSAVKTAESACSEHEKKETKKEEKAEEKKEEGKKVEETKGAAVEYDPACITTAQQQWLLERGVVVPDAKTAEILFNQQLVQGEQVKMAELETLAEEERCKGALQYHGMLKESTAMRLAEGEATAEDVVKVASWIGIAPAEIVKRAEQLAAAATSPALVDGHLGTAARITSAVQAAAEHNNNTTEFSPEAASGTRGPVSTQDEKLFRFTDTFVLPGNPGLNYGMTVNQGKGFSA